MNIDRRVFLLSFSLLSSFFSIEMIQTDAFCLPRAHNMIPRDQAGGAAPAMAASLRSRRGLYRFVMAVAG